jgi:hypothetical protein
MLSARKEEVFPVEDDVKKGEGPIYTRVELRLTRLEDKVSVIATGVAELKSDVKGLSTRMTDGFQSVHKELSSAKIWALLIAAAMLGVIARGFHWI